MFNLYGKFDICNHNNINSFDYGQMVLNSIQPGKLNIIEGGTAFYLYFLKTKILTDFKDIKTLFCYYDTTKVGGLLSERVEKMFIEGAFYEFLNQYFRFQK